MEYLLHWIVPMVAGLLLAVCGFWLHHLADKEAASPKSASRD